MFTALFRLYKTWGRSTNCVLCCIGGFSENRDDFERAFCTACDTLQQHLSSSCFWSQTSGGHENVFQRLTMASQNGGENIIPLRHI